MERAKPKNPSEAESQDEYDKRHKRLEFLLKQTEVFSHFMVTTGTKPNRKGGSFQESPTKSSNSASNEWVHIYLHMYIYIYTACICAIRYHM